MAGRVLRDRRVDACDELHIVLKVVEAAEELHIDPARASCLDERSVHRLVRRIRADCEKMQSRWVVAAGETRILSC